MTVSSCFGRINSSRDRVEDYIHIVMKAGLFIVHPAFFHNPPRTFVVGVCDGDYPLKTGDLKPIFEPGHRTFITETLPPEFFRQVVSDLDLARVFERDESTGTDAFAGTLEHNHAKPKTKSLVAIKIEL